MSRYPTGQACLSKTSQDAARFLLHLWRELGIATYTQMDNEGCFSGGATHPYVLGRVLRLCLLVGTQAVFIPIRHPKSNAAIERFHQDYNQHVWQRHYLDDMTTLNFHADLFFDTYRTTHYPAALNGQTPQQVHAACPQRPLPTHFAPTLDKLPITEGQVHFIRKVQSDGTISILNVPWQVPAAAQQGVWATLSLSTTQSEGVLAVFDDAPTALSRARLITHSFPLPDSVVPLRAEFRSVPITAMLPIWPRPLARLAQKVLTMF